MYEPAPPCPAPVLTLDSQKVEAFESLFLKARRLGPAAFIDYHIAYPKHEFLRYLVDRKQILLHGSPYPDLKVLVPLRLSTDPRAAMNRQSIFASADAIVPMFFAILDHEKYSGSTSNGSYRLFDANGLATTYYVFTINEKMLNLRPFRCGTVYLLPKDKFAPAAAGHGVILEEWISEEPVPVLAKLSISPDDFPFVNAIGVHNEGEQAWLTATIQTCAGAVEDSDELEDGYCFKFPGGDEWTTRLAELCRIRHKFSPFLKFEVVRDSSNESIYLKVTGPQGTKQLIRSILGMYS